MRRPRWECPPRGVSLPPLVCRLLLHSCCWASQPRIPTALYASLQSAGLPARLAPRPALALHPLRQHLRQQQRSSSSSQRHRPPLRTAAAAAGDSGSESEGEEAPTPAGAADDLSESELEEESRPLRAAPNTERGVRRALQLPLEAAATMAKEDARYLQKRQRSKWWRRSEFPRVPADTIADVEKSGAPGLQVCGWVLVCVLMLLWRVMRGMLGMLADVCWLQRCSKMVGCCSCLPPQRGPSCCIIPHNAFVPLTVCTPELCACLSPTGLQIWAKVVPLGLIFFVASFNLTILQAGGAGRGPQCTAEVAQRHGSAALVMSRIITLLPPSLPFHPRTSRTPSW